MMADIAKDLKVASYEIGRVVKSGTDHFIQLKISSQKDLDLYKEL